jgi:hypothetical protein
MSDYVPLAETCSSFYVCLYLFKAVIDNKDALEELVTRTGERLALVNTALVDEDEGVQREMIEHFSRYAQIYLLNISVLILYRILIDNILELSNMSKRATWKNILESDEDKMKIKETFERIDEHTKNFHVRPSTYLNQS